MLRKRGLIKMNNFPRPLELTELHRRFLQRLSVVKPAFDFELGCSVLIFQELTYCPNLEGPYILRKFRLGSKDCFGGGLRVLHCFGIVIRVIRWGGKEDEAIALFFPCEALLQLECGLELGDAVSCGAIRCHAVRCRMREKGGAPTKSLPFPS